MKKLLISVCLISAWLACNKDDSNPTGDYDNYDQVIDEGGPVNEPPPPSQEVLSSSLADTLQVGGLWRCITERLKIGYHAGGQNGFPQFNPNASVIYPGSLLQGSSLNKATPDVIAVERAGGTISIDINDGSQQSFFEVDKVTKSSITDASNAIIAASTGTIPANMEFSYEKIQSKEQMAAALKLDYHNSFVELEGKLSFSSDQEYNRTIVNLTQSYYTMSFDIPTSLEQVFDPAVTPDDLAKYVGPGNPATYISDVTYGRIYMLLIETTSSVVEMDAAVNASFSGVGGSGGGADAMVHSLDSLQNLKVKLFAFGGEASSTLLTIGHADDLDALIELLAEGSDIRTGKPISYVVRSVYNNQIVKVGLNTEYDVTNCEPLNPNGPPPQSFNHWTGLLLTFGPIGSVTTLNGGDKMLLTNQAGTHYLISEDHGFTGPFHIDELGNEPCPFSAIGASAYIGPPYTGNHTIYFFDKSGLNYALFDVDSSTWGFESSILLWDNGSFPFGLNGASAAMNYLFYGNPPGPYTIYLAFFEANSDQICSYYIQEANFSASHTMDGFFPTDPPFPFEGVAAATGFKIGNQLFWMLFNETGDRYVILENGTHFYVGPFRL